MRSGIRACCLLPLAFFTATSAGAAELHGKVMENELAGTPMAGVEIGTPGANPTATGNLGLFRLVLPRRQPGEAVSLTVRKEGFAVVNDVQLEVTLLLKPEDRPHTLLLCRPKDCEEMRRRFYRLKGVEAVEASHQRKLDQARQATAAELVRLKEERDAALIAVERTATELARTRPAESSEMYQKALRLFLDGQVSEALDVLDEEILQSSLAAVVQAYLLRGKLLTLQLRFADAEKAYQTAVEIAPENLEASSALANFAGDQRRYAQATAAFQRHLELARKLGEEAEAAMALNGLGVQLSDQNRLDEARKAYDEALAIRRQLVTKNPDVHLPYLAQTLINLGMLLVNLKRLDEAREALGEALDTYRQLAEKDPHVYRHYIARTLNILSFLLGNQNRLDEARKALNEALETYRQLSAKSPDVYQPYVAMVLNNLGRLLHHQERIDESRKAYKEALDIRRQLALKDPDAYLPDVATTLDYLGTLLEDSKHLEEALDIRRRLAAQNPDVFLPSVAETLINLGDLLRTRNRRDEARKAVVEASAIVQPFVAKNPEKFQSLAERARQVLQQVEDSP